MMAMLMIDYQLLKLVTEPAASTTEFSQLATRVLDVSALLSCSLDQLFVVNLIGDDIFCHSDTIR